MPARKVRDVKKRLTDKFGFAVATAAGDSHQFYARAVPGVGQVSTHFSHGDTDLRDTLIAAVAGQLRVTAGYFKGMLDCHNGCDAWIRQIQESPAGPLSRYRKPPG